MMRAGNELMKMLREDMEMSQEEMAEHLHMSQRTISRIESGKRNLGVWEYIALMQMAGTPTDDLSPLLLDSNEVKDYRVYRKLIKILQGKKYAEAREVLLDFEKNPTTKQGFILQFIAYVKVVSDEKMPPEQTIEELYKALSMSIKNFDHKKAGKYRYTYNEMIILIGIGLKLEEIGRGDSAIAMYKALIESKGGSLATDDDRATLFPTLMYNMCFILGKADRFEEALSYCKDAYEISVQYDNYRLIPKIVYYLGYFNYMLGEEEQVYRVFYTRAYHTAYALGDRETAAIIKEEAKKIGLKDL